MAKPKQDRFESAVFSAEELKVLESQRHGYSPNKQSYKSQDRCLATFLLAIINQAVIDVLSEPIKVKVVSDRNIYEKGLAESYRKDALGFLKSKDCVEISKRIAVLGRTTPNLKYIVKKCEEMVAKGIFFTRDQMDEKVQESDREEELLTPLD